MILHVDPASPHAHLAAEHVLGAAPRREPIAVFGDDRLEEATPAA